MVSHKNSMHTFSPVRISKNDIVKKICRIRKTWSYVINHRKTITQVSLISH